MRVVAILITLLLALVLASWFSARSAARDRERIATVEAAAQDATLPRPAAEIATSSAARPPDLPPKQPSPPEQPSPLQQPWHETPDENGPVELLAARALARETGRPLLVEFSGFTSPNARWMEIAILREPEVVELLERHFVSITLFTDRDGEPWRSNRALHATWTNPGPRVVPQYHLLTGNTRLPENERPHRLQGFTRSKQAFLDFLQSAFEDASGSASPPPAPAAPPAPVGAQPFTPTIVVGGYYFDVERMERDGLVDAAGRGMAYPLQGEPHHYVVHGKGEIVVDAQKREVSSISSPWSGYDLSAVRPERVTLGDLEISIGDSQSGKVFVAHDEAGARVWQFELGRPRGPEGIGLTGFEDDVIVFGFERMSDSGVTLARLGRDGRARWQTTTSNLGIPHSKYWHLGYVAVFGNRLYVISQGSGGNIVEELDPYTGATLRRVQF